MELSLSKKQSLAIAVLFLLAVATAFLIGFFFREVRDGASADYSLLREAQSVLEDNALNPLPAEPALEYGMIRGMLQAYNDPYTVFVDPPQHEIQTDQLQGKFGGIGTRLDRDSDNYVLLYPLPDSPAARYGILEGDRLLKVDNLETPAGVDIALVEAAIRGPAGESVSLVVAQAPAFEPRTISVVRAEVPLPSTTWNLAPDAPQVGLIHVNLIAASTADEITRAVEDLRSRGAQSLILDLRNNGGGLLDAGIDVVRLFLSQGTIIQQNYRNQSEKTYSVEKPGLLVDMPLVVVVNKNSASAAEIIAGVLQSSGRAKLVGEPTFGKDTVQLVFDLSDGSSVHVTSGKWSIPGQVVPLQPDVLIPDDPNNPNAPVSAAVQILQNP